MISPGAAGALAAMMLLCGSLPPCLAVHGSKPPPFKEKAAYARWLMHENVWGVLSTMATLNEFAGGAFGNMQSFADGPEGNATGIL